MEILFGPISLNLSDKPRFTRPELLYHLPIPATLHGVNPRTIEGKEWWDAVRKDAYARNNECCFACGTFQLDVAGPHQWLEAHECYDYDFERYVLTYREVVALCPYCHKFIHWLGLRATPKTMREVLAHGLCVMEKAGLKLPNGQHWYAAITYYRYEAFKHLVAPVPSFKELYYKLKFETWTLLYKGGRYDSTCRDPTGTHK